MRNIKRFYLSGSNKLKHVFIAISLLFIFIGCSTSPKTHFYTLNTLPDLKEKVSIENSQRIALGIWPVKLSPLLDRPEIVTRVNQHNIELANFHKWIGGLSNDMTQLIANELGKRLQTDRVLIYPWSSYVKHDYQVKILVNQFVGELGNDVVLKGSWSLLNAEGDREITHNAFTLNSKSQSKNYGDMVATQRELLIQLSEQISNTVSTTYSTVKNPSKS